MIEDLNEEHEKKLESAYTEWEENTTRVTEEHEKELEELQALLRIVNRRLPPIPGIIQ